MQSIGFSALVAALATVRDMNEVAAAGELWICTTRVDGSHVPAVVGSGSGAAVLMKAGVDDLEPAEALEPLPAALAVAAE